jgi:hypothetical protein
MANEQFLVAPDRIGDAYDRARTVGTVYDRVLRRESLLAQAADENEESTILRGKIGRVGDLVARSGDRVSGADIVVDRDVGTVTLTDGRIYVRGDVRPVSAATLEGVSFVGDVIVGVRFNTAIVTHEEDPALLGLHDGTAALGEPGAVRERVTLSWGYEGDAGEGDLYQVYLLRNGFVVDQAPPPSLTGINQAIAIYDSEAHGNYIARGCEVTALGSDGSGNQLFSIAEGSANILGFKRVRNTGIRHSQPEEPDLRSVASEPNTFDDAGDGSATITVNRPPINGVTSVIVTKEATETIVRGGVANTSDLLSNSGVTEIVSVVQGATTYVATTDYVRNGDRVDWSPGGAEPAGGSSYDVTYRYLAAVTPDSVDARTIVVSGGVDGQPVFVSYSYKLPRHDRICLDAAGHVVYLKGLPSLAHPRAPKTPETLLSLAVVQNDWYDAPTVVNDGTRAIPFERQWRYFNRLVELLGLVAEERLQSNIAFRQPTAKFGVFVDPFESDRYRDAGETQNGAVFQGSFQIPVDPEFVEITLSGPIFLDYTEAFAVTQEWVTGCMRINPYQNFTPPAPRLDVVPSRDFWVESNTQWLSPSTQVFGWGNSSRVTSTEIVSSSTTVAARFLRQINVSFTLRDYGNGETLEELTFDGIDVTPAGPLAAGPDGVINGSFAIPANVTAGAKLIRARSGSGRVSTARFTGEGRIETIRLREVTTVERFQQVVWDDTSQGESPGPDPLAQSFALDQGQHVTGIDVKFCAIGDRTKPVLAQIVTMENGFPTTEVLAQARIDMTPVIVGQWTRFDLPFPLYLPAGRQFAWVFLTDDADHALSIAERDGFDASRQRYVGAQPYTVGVLFSSSNAVTWTAHQNADLTFRIRAARFAPATKTVPLGTYPVVDVSDFIVEAGVVLPTDAAQLVFEIQPEGETAVRVEPGQVWERTSFFTGNVAVRAILTGSTLVSPLMSRDLLLIKGTMQEDGVYISRAFEVGEDKTVDVVLGTKLPSGATLTVSVDQADDNWSELTQASANVLADGAIERTFRVAAFAGPTARMKLVLTGTPAARPVCFDNRAYSY